MIRRLFTIAAAISLVLCVVTAILWVRSYWVAEGWRELWFDRNEEPTRRIDSALYLGWFRGVVFNCEWEALGNADFEINSDESRDMGHVAYAKLTGINDPPWAHLSGEIRQSFGFTGQYEHLNFPVGRVELIVVTCGVPYWFLALVFALLPSLWMFSKRRGYARGLCLHCGYDLRATPERCPESGMQVAKATQ